MGALGFTLSLLLSALLGGVIGYERERVHRPAGLRTHMIVALGSYLISYASITAFPGDPARLLSGIVTGIGFLGAGTIFREKDLIKGLTTAATIWATAAVGIAIALGFLREAIITAIIIYAVLELKHFRFFRVWFQYDEDAYLRELEAYVKPAMRDSRVNREKHDDAKRKKGRKRQKKEKK